jgi:hypothetical protein
VLTVREGTARAARYWFAQAAQHRMAGNARGAREALTMGNYASKRLRWHHKPWASLASEYTYAIGQISACSCCMLTEANGECCGGEGHRDAPPLGRIAWPITVVNGGTHDRCANDPEWIGAECDCESLGFSWATCDACGSALGGDRYAMTLFDESARPIVFGIYLECAQ